MSPVAATPLAAAPITAAVAAPISSAMTTPATPLLHPASAAVKQGSLFQLVSAVESDSICLSHGCNSGKRKTGIPGWNLVVTQGSFNYGSRISLNFDYCGTELTTRVAEAARSP
jgi:hypothetical protein